MEMQETQKKIKDFIDARKWGETYQVYGIMLNIIEEVGETWNIVKHLEKEEEKLLKVIDESHEELEDDIGDLMYLVFKLACVLKVDAHKAVENRLKEYEERFPADFMSKHTFAGNRRVGGVDYKYQKRPPKN